MSESRKTVDHKTIREWIEQRQGRPAIVRSTEENDGGLLRVDFQEPDEALEPVSWEKFFKIFDSRKLAFLYQDRTADGEESRFNKFIER